MPNSSGNAFVQSDSSLELMARKKGHVIYEAPLKENKSFSFEDEHKYCSVFLSQSLTRKERHECLAHELGHCEYAGFYTISTPNELRSRKEYRANKWAFLRLAPPGEVKMAIKAGCKEIWELAEWFDVTDEFMKRILDYYSNQHLL